MVKLQMKQTYEYAMYKSTKSNMHYRNIDPSWNVPSSRENMAANGPTSAQQDRRRPSIGQKWTATWNMPYQP